MRHKDLIIVPVIAALACIFIAGCLGTPNPGNSTIPATPANSHISSPVTTMIPQSVTIDLTAKNMSYNTSTISVPAGADVVVRFQNLEARGSAQITGIPHNFAVYQNANATSKIFSGDIVTGGENITYRFTAPATPGTYFFRCDIHPAVMTGKFIVT